MYAWAPIVFNMGRVGLDDLSWPVACLPPVLGVGAGGTPPSPTTGVHGYYRRENSDILNKKSCIFVYI